MLLTISRMRSTSNTPANAKFSAPRTRSDWTSRSTIPTGRDTVSGALPSLSAVGPKSMYDHSAGVITCRVFARLSGSHMLGGVQVGGGSAGSHCCCHLYGGGSQRTVYAV